MTPRAKRAATPFWVGVVVLTVLHVDPWNVGPADPWFGVIPHDLGYHLVWTIVAGLLILYLTVKVWAEPE